MNDIRNVYFHELVEGLNLMANNLPSIGLSNIRFQDMAVVGQKFVNRRHGGRNGATLEGAGTSNQFLCDLLHSLHNVNQV